MSAGISEEFPFESKFLDIKGNKIHYIDEGKGDPILFIHGNPASSYIWRNIIPYVTGDARVLALDLIGMGKSDQPDLEYGFTDAYEYLEAFIEKLNLKNITLVVQDWGSGLGFHYANTHRDNIKGLAFMEAMYGPVDWKQLPISGKIGMILLRSGPTSWLMLGLLNMFVKNFVPAWIERKLTARELEEYARPFPTLKSRKAVRVFPRDVPVKGKPEHTARAVASYHEWLQKTEIPKICFYADPGLLIPVDRVGWIAQNFPNTKMIDIGKGTHFVQEDMAPDRERIEKMVQ